MTGNQPGKRGGVVLAFGGLGAAVMLTASFLITDRPAAQQPQASAYNENASDVDAVASIPAAYSLRIYREANRIKLKGEMPSEEDHKTLIGLVKGSFATIEISDRVKAANKANANVKVGGVSFALRVLNCLDTGIATIDETSVMFEGVAASAACYEDIRSRIGSDVPPGVTVKTTKISRPSNSLYWHAKIGGGLLSISGAVADEKQKKKLDSRARELFTNLEIDNRTVLAQEAPESWTMAALHSLKVLQHLEAGSVQMTDQAIRVEGTVANEDGLKEVDALADKYPRGFSLESKVVKQAGILSVPQATTAGH